MKKVSEMTATEMMQILSKKNIPHSYAIGHDGQSWIGIRMKSAHFYWLGFHDENCSVESCQIYSANDNKTLTGIFYQNNVIKTFQKMIK